MYLNYFISIFIRKLRLQKSQACRTFKALADGLIKEVNHFIDLPAIMSGINGCSLYDNTSVNNRFVNAVKNVCDYTWDTKEIVKGLL